VTEVLEGRATAHDPHVLAKEALSKAEDLKAELIMAQVDGGWGGAGGEVGAALAEVATLVCPSWGARRPVRW
jgi:hypothetical protein